MSDYIKREDAIEQARRNWTGEGDWIASTEINLLKNLPTADVVEVVRCKDCKYLNAGGNDVKYWRICTRQQKKYFDVYEDSFCSYGERAEQ